MSKNVKLIIILSVALLVIIICGIYAAQIPKNKAISMEEQIKTAESNIQVQEKRRADLFPNLVDCVKQYDKHEYETLLAIIEARGTSSDEASNEIQLVINAVAEQYPDLKSSKNYQQLMTEIAVTENLISEYRSNYNSQVKNYNRYVKSFPARGFLKITGYDVLEYDYLEYVVSVDAPTNMFD